MIIRTVLTAAMTLAAAGMVAAGEVAPVSSSALAPDTVRLSLDSCMTIALDQSPTIKIADLEIRRADYSRAETLGQLLPSVSFGATYNRTLAKQTMYMNMSGLGSASGGGDDEAEGSAPEVPSRPNGIKVGLDNSFSLGFTASMPLIAPQLWKALEISESRILETVEQSRQSRLSLVNSVRNAYYTLLLAIDSRRTIEESYDMARVTAEIYAARYEVGTASQYDVLRTQVAMTNIEPELTQADIAVKQARLQLSILMGIDPGDAVIAPTVALADYQSEMYGEALARRADMSAEGNSSLRLLDIQARQARQNLSAHLRSLLPTLALSANYNWTSMSDGSPLRNFRWSPYSSLGLTLSVPLFEGMQRSARIRQAKVQVRQLEWQRLDLERSVNMQIELAIDNINSNIRQIESSAMGVTQAEKAHDIMQRSFEIGSASYLDLRDSELALTRSRLAYYQSVFNYLVAESDLDLLLGRPIK